MAYLQNEHKMSVHCVGKTTTISANATNNIKTI